jgi:serine/threonine protein kinase
MKQDQTCSKCGAKLTSGGAPEGLCPQCLLKLGLESQGSEPRTDSWAHAPKSSKQEDQTPGAIGPYRILEILGEGGMGVVYLAEQVEPIRRRVALKVVKPGMDTREVLARFDAERQALAVMNHTNVAKVFDAGVTEQGRPYFVMEYVPGIRITEYCDMRCLSVRERLELFTKVCEAIQHAHQKGVIHRDIKPSNVLVASEDGKPAPKIIDFGLAKAMGQQLTAKTLFTQQGVLIGTPEYMSPEQAGKTPLDVDARTDIYSLGVLLYELLVGVLPFEPATLRRAAAVEMLRIIKEEDPPRPVTKLGSLGDTASEVARRRQTDVRSLARQLQGELEWITIRAMEKDPGRRYQSASEFAADVTRHLSNEPVVAGHPSRVYRLKKIIWKHRTAAAVVAFSFVILLAAFVVSTSLYIQSEAARQRAETEARSSALEAEAIQAILLDDPGRYETLSAEATKLHRSLLENGESNLAIYLVNRLSILNDFSGDRQDWEKLKTEALELVNRALDKNDPAAVQTAALLAKYLTPEEADSLARRALTQARGRVAGLDRSSLDALELLIQKLQIQSLQPAAALDDEAVEQVYRESLARNRKVLPAQSPSIVQTQKSLAAVLERKAARLLRAGDAAQSESVLREVLNLLPIVDPEGSARKAKLQSDLGAALIALNRPGEAEQELLGAIPVLEKDRGENNAATQIARNRLANLYAAWKRPADAARVRALQPEISIEEAWDLGPLRYEGVAAVEGGGRSVFLGGKSIWIFKEARTLRPGINGSTLKQATLGWTDKLDASKGFAILDGLKDAAGVPSEILPLSKEDAAYNQAHSGKDCIEPCGARRMLAPGAVVADSKRNRMLMFYNRMLQFGGKSERAGTSLAVWNAGSSALDRSVVREGAATPRILFGADEPNWGSAALVVDDWMYAYGCECQNLGCSCRLARVPLASASDRSAWQFFATNGHWSSNWRDAQPVLRGGIQSGILSVHWNPYIGQFLAIYSRVLDARITIRFAERPEGPWTEKEMIEVDTLHSAPNWVWTTWGLGHPELMRDGGRTEHVSYWRNMGTRQIYLMELRFAKK